MNEIADYNEKLAERYSVELEKRGASIPNFSTEYQGTINCRLDETYLFAEDKMPRVLEILEELYRLQE